MIRRALPSESALLSALALRSKAHWGYDAEFLEACREALRVTPDYVERAPVFVAEEGARVVGFYGLGEKDGDADLLFFFVEPDAIGRRHGKRLWRHAVTTARSLGYRRLRIESDPYAEGFYLAMGAVRVGEAPSDAVAGRLLPLLRFRC
jgi:GNAT superfamily N-acetyltransferase